MASQDMPPPGGFAHINVERTFPKAFIRQGIYCFILIGMSIHGLYYLKDWKRRLRILRLEQTEHYVAASPFMIVEQERKFLNHLYTLREQERELMKDHPGWKLGTLYGEPIFKTLPKDVLPPICQADYTAHRLKKEWIYHVVNPDHHQ